MFLYLYVIVCIPAGIPEQAEVANTYYDQYNEFDEDDSEGERNAMMTNLQSVLNIEHTRTPFFFFYFCYFKYSSKMFILNQTSKQSNLVRRRTVMTVKALLNLFLTLTARFNMQNIK